jgi:hypothetical protein
MSPGAVARRGLVHGVACYEDEEQSLDLVVPFVQGGLDADEPTMVALDDRHSELVGSVIAPSPHLSFMPRAYDRSARALKSFDKALRGICRRGARRIRIVGELPHSELDQ